MKSDISILPKGYPVRRRGSCVPAAYLIARKITGPDVHVVWGYVGYNGPCIEEHTWVEVRGEIIDPTIRQFRWWRKGIEVRRRLIGSASRGDAILRFECLYAQADATGQLYRNFAKWIEL